MITWGTVENALHAWVVVGSGLSADQVIFEDQKAARPSGQYISIRYDIDTPSYDWNQQEVLTGTPVPGAEIAHITRGTRELSCTLQCFRGLPVKESSPKALLNNVLTRTSVKSQKLAFRAAGIGFLRREGITSLSGAIAIELEPRAIVNVVFSAAEEIFETGTFIEGVEFQMTDPVLLAARTVGNVNTDIPINVSAVPGDEENVISWGGSAAEEFHIYWDTSPGVTKITGTKIADVTSPHTHTGLSNGTTYYYIVTAENLYGESDESAEVSATPSA